MSAVPRGPDTSAIPDHGASRGTFADAGNPSARFEADSDEDAAKRLLTLTSGLVARAGSGPGTVNVLGQGMLGNLLRERIGSATAGLKPMCIIDTTGDVDELSLALASLGDGGVLLLATPPRSSALVLDPYPDLHSRGLTIEGWSLDRVVARHDVGDADVEWILGQLSVTASPEPPSDAWLWCRFGDVTVVE